MQDHFKPLENINSTRHYSNTLLLHFTTENIGANLLFSWKKEYQKTIKRQIPRNLKTILSCNMTLWRIKTSNSLMPDETNNRRCV